MVEYSEDLRERFDVLQDDVDLIKNQIKQNLVDLREFIMSSRTIFPGNHQPGSDQKRKSTGEPSVDDPYFVSGKDMSLKGRDSYSHPNHYEETAMSKDTRLDAGTVGNIIWWLGTIKRRGLSLRQLGQFLEAYETSGLLDHSISKLVKVMIRSMEDVNESVGSSSDQQGTPEEYADCLLQFSEIFCSASVRQDIGFKVQESGPFRSGQEATVGVYTNGNGVHSQE